MLNPVKTRMTAPKHYEHEQRDGEPEDDHQRGKLFERADAVFADLLLV